ncbi:MAG: hypothetical protein IJ381_08000 [Clostridia bacterium]|nr:hypothetical protein [Clostridia bacterium]
MASSRSSSVTTGRSESQNETISQKFLDETLLNRILAGLTGGMTDQEIEKYAESMLKPQLSAGLEASQQNYETAKLAKEQEIEDLARSLSAAIGEQKSAYGKAMADTEKAALARGMGRSSYAVETLANQGKALAGSIQALTNENQRQRNQIYKQITQAAQQNAQTKGRLNQDYASNLAAKVQELRDRQKQEYNQNYMAAISGSIGEKTTGTQRSKQTNTMESHSYSSSH